MSPRILLMLLLVVPTRGDMYIELSGAGTSEVNGAYFPTDIVNQWASESVIYQRVDAEGVVTPNPMRITYGPWGVGPLSNEWGWVIVQTDVLKTPTHLMPYYNHYVQDNTSIPPTTGWSVLVGGNLAKGGKAPVPTFRFYTLPPSAAPTISPSSTPPTSSPTTSPTISPTTSPTTSPTSSPTSSPTTAPTNLPTNSPSLYPSSFPTTSPRTHINIPTTHTKLQSSSAPTSLPTLSTTTISSTITPTSSPSEAVSTVSPLQGTSNKMNASTITVIILAILVLVLVFLAVLCRRHVRPNSKPATSTVDSSRQAFNSIYESSA
eukprot:m.92140 g.92140  ORF g.92140 m.92140 type:complete len:320 (+) comp26524_c0_seq2:76-1035(+)